MAIGERIRFIRNLRGMTQKYLGTLVGVSERTADIRMAQYEAGTRTPKAELTKALAEALDVSPLALQVPDIDTDLGFMHTMFALEDLYGLTVERRDGEVLLRIDPRRGRNAAAASKMIDAWASAAEKYEYDKWRYYYPQYDDTQITAKVPSQELSDAMVKAFKGEIKD